MSWEKNWYVIWGKVERQPSNCTFWLPEKLAIVGIQPFFSPDGRFLLVGDVWLSNRDNLLTRAKITVIKSDLALLAKLWQEEGIQCLERLEGIFSFLVWDKENNYLLLVRDRVGANTLYHTNNSYLVAIAPRLKTLKSFHNNQLDLLAFRDYLACAFVPGERTLWQQVKELRPGSILFLPDNKTEFYWQATEVIPSEKQSLDWYAEKLRSQLFLVVKEYLPRDESVGIFLSGGLDSSCITALATCLHHAPVHTYSIHFGSESPNELEFSSLVAKHCQTEHHILEITPQEMWNNLSITMGNLDDPIGDPLTVPNYLLAQLARKDVGVILNGEGGDPCFGGPKNQPMLLNNLYSNNLDLVGAYLNSFQKCFNDLPRLFKPEIYWQIKNEIFIFAEDLSSQEKYLNRLMLLNIKYKGADHILTKVNNLMSSANLFGRSPLFDGRIVEMAIAIPPEYKLAGAEEKAVLKAAVKDLLPREIIQRPKSGMMVPVQLGFKKYWQREARKLLLNKKSTIATYINQNVVEDWLNYRGDIWQRYGVKLWLLVSLELWLNEHLN